MTDRRFSPQPLAGWYMIGAVAALLFAIAACAAFVVDLRTDPTTLPLDQRAAFVARPLWMVVGYGIAVGTGLAGALMLLLRRKIAQPLLLVSLAGAAVTFLPFVLVPAVRDNITTNDIAVAIVILAISWTIFWFARHSSQRGWLH